MKNFIPGYKTYSGIAGGVVMLFADKLGIPIDQETAQIIGAFFLAFAWNGRRIAFK